MASVEIVSRKDWGARYEDGFGAAPLPATRLYLHHSVTIAPDLQPPFDDDDAAIRTLEQIGEDRFGRGISYTFVVTPVGRIYEGHGIGRQGAHTKGLNSVARAICWVGNYETAKPTQQMIDATVRLVRHGHAQGWWPSRLTGGHRDAPGASTACPGKNAYALIGDMNLLATTSPAPPEDELSWSDQLPDLYPAALGPDGKPTRTIDAGTQLAYATARSAQALEAATYAAKGVDALLGEVRALRQTLQTSGGSPVDYDAFIRTFAAELLDRLA